MESEPTKPPAAAKPPAPAPIPDHLRCPRCEAPLEPIEGWIEYGDREVPIAVMGCFVCGYNDAEEFDWH